MPHERDTTAASDSSGRPARRLGAGRGAAVAAVEQPARRGGAGTRLRGGRGAPPGPGAEAGVNWPPR